MPSKLSVFLLWLWLAMCLQGSTLAQSDKAQVPAQTSTPPKDPASVTALMPQPRSVHYGDGWLQVKGSFQVKWLGYRNSALERAVSRFQNNVARRTGLDAGRAGAAQLRIDCRGEDKGYLTIDAGEHYALVGEDLSVVAG